MLRLIVTLLLAALLALGCKSAPMTSGVTPAVLGSPLLQGELILPSGYQAQASSGQVKANATVTLIDPATFQAKGTGLTATDGTFTVQALGTFTPTLGTLYLLESTKTLGGAASTLFRLRTLVQLTATGWTSISGNTIQLSTATTAVTLLWDHHGLAATAVLGKVSYDATTRTHRMAGLTSALGELEVREVEGLVQEALLRDSDPIQVVRPGPDGTYRLSLSPLSHNLLTNSGFEEGGTGVPGWRFFNPVSVGTFSVETTVVYEGARSVRLKANAAGDLWLGQGAFWEPSDGAPLMLGAGKTYTLSLYARGAAGGERLTLGGSPAVTLTTSWQRYTFSWTATGYDPIVILRPGSVAGQATFPATVYLDAVQLEEGKAPTAYEPQGNLLVEGFANAKEAVGITPADGWRGEGVRVDQGVNMLTNSSFETDANSDGIPDGMGTSGVVTCALDADYALFGARSLRIESSPASTSYMFHTITYPFKAGSTYTFSVWVKGSGVSAPPSLSDFGIYIDAIRASDGGYDASYLAAAPTGTFDWTRLSVTGTFRNDCSSVKVIPILRKKSGTAWFDGFQVEAGTRATPYAGDGKGGTLDTLAFDAKTSLNAYQGTLSFWYRPAHGWEESAGQLMSVTSAVSDENVFDIANLPGPSGFPQLRFHLMDGSTWRQGAVWQPATAPWIAGSWHHLAITWGRRGMELYFDGAQVASDPYTGPIMGGQALKRLVFSGTYGNFAANPNGTLDGLKIWDVQKSPEWISRDYLGLAP